MSQTYQQSSAARLKNRLKTVTKEGPRKLKRSQSAVTARANNELLKTSPPEVVKAARTICRHYHSLLFSKMRMGSRHGVLQRYKDLPGSTKVLFLKAAADCVNLGADPKRYVFAQFEAFLSFGKLKKRILLLPQPHQLYGLNACARYLSWHAAQQRNEHLNADSAEKQLKGFFREERKLRGLSTYMRLPESDVLVTRPSEFSRAFLEHKGVWEIVKDTYAAQMDV